MSETPDRRIPDLQIIMERTTTPKHYSDRRTFQLDRKSSAKPISTLDKTYLHSSTVYHDDTPATVVHSSARGSSTLNNEHGLNGDDNWK